MSQGAAARASTSRNLTQSSDKSNRHLLSNARATMGGDYIYQHNPDAARWANRQLSKLESQICNSLIDTDSTGLS